MCQVQNIKNNKRVTSLPCEIIKWNEKPKMTKIFLETRKYENYRDNSIISYNWNDQDITYSMEPETDNLRKTKKEWNESFLQVQEDAEKITDLNGKCNTKTSLQGL